MTALAAACLWAVAANLLAVMPSRRRHVPQAMVLVATGIPILGWVTWANGPWLGLLVLLGGMSVLRWPLFFLWRRLFGNRAG